MTKDDIELIKNSEADTGWIGSEGIGIEKYILVVRAASNLLDWAKRAADTMTRASWSCRPEEKEAIEKLLEEVTFGGPKKMSKSG